MAPLGTWAAIAALGLVPLAQAWHNEEPPCPTEFEPFEYAGCYADTDGKSLVYRSSEASDDMTVEKCSAICKGKLDVHLSCHHRGGFVCVQPGHGLTVFQPNRQRFPLLRPQVLRHLLLRQRRRRRAARRVRVLLPLQRQLGPGLRRRQLPLRPQRPHLPRPRRRLRGRLRRHWLLDRRLLRRPRPLLAAGPAQLRRDDPAGLYRRLQGRRLPPCRCRVRRRVLVRRPQGRRLRVCLVRGVRHALQRRFVSDVRWPWPHPHLPG